MDNQLRIDELLDRWEKAQAAGAAIPVEELCRDCPELIDELKRQIDALNDHLETKPYAQAPVSTKPTTAGEGPVPAGAELSTELKYGELRYHDEGGLGVIYVGADQKLHREVVLKFIHQRLAEDSDSQARFVREAEVTARLEHPGVVPVYSVGETKDGQRFYTMRFIRGETLEAAIARHHHSEQGQRLTRERSLEFRNLLNRLVSVCQTIAYVHNRGIVHRDIKPDNIMLGRYGETLVVDWGLALPVGRDARARASGEKTLLPRSGEGSGTSLGGGTPAYMSPEQAEPGGEVGPAADIYALGATLYKLLTGVAPFQGPNVREVLHKVRHGDFLPPGRVKPGVSAALASVCLKAMALEPAKRYATAQDLAQDLERWLADEPVSTHRESLPQKLGRWSRRHRAVTLSAVIGLVAVLLVSLVSAGWLGNLARQEREAREQGLRLSAKFAARTVADEMDLRFRLLETEADDPDLRDLLGKANEQPDDSLRAPLQAWVNARYLKHDRAAKASSWFVDDRRGTMLALAGNFGEDPARHLGKNYAYRDYFHGLGKPLEPDQAVNIKPIDRPHRSHVFVSKTDRKLKVAFSVPVHAGKKAGPVLGVLAMTVELGRFGALQAELGPNRFAALVDTGSDWIDGDERQGLILHHRRLVELAQEGAESRSFRLDADLRQRLTSLRAQRLRRDDGNGALTEERQQTPDNLDLSYDDPTGGRYEGRWLAAFEPIFLKGPNRVKDTGWVVIVQERR